jgi:DNA replication and repair protein RecF
MRFRHLELRQFRNYDQARIEFHPSVNLFVGPNGQGKTNLIEALHLLTHGNSFRPGSTPVWLRRGGEAIAGEVRGLAEKSNLLSEIAFRFSEAEKNFSLNGKRVSPSTLSNQFPSVLFSPESLAAIKEGPEQRRALLDDVLVTLGPMQERALRDFRRALRSRNRLLRDFRQGVYPEPQFVEVLDAFDEVYIPLAATLAHERILLLNQIEPLLQRAAALIDPRYFVDISVDYVISKERARHWDLRQVLDSMRSRLKSLKKFELASGTSLVGPQKHELNFLSAGNDARYFCSQGQQRALILAFKMAQIMYHDQVLQTQPLLLLDDVLSELDPEKGANLLRFLESVRSQIILTTTDIAFPFDFSDRGFAINRVTEGHVESWRA